MIKKNIFWIFIPARSGSKGIKNKNFYNVFGKPLIYFTLKTTSRIIKLESKVEKVIFSSDSIQYYEYVKKIIAVGFHKRSKKISSDSSTDFEVFKDFVMKLYKANTKLPEFFIHLRPTTPLRKVNILIKAINNFLSKKKNYSALRSVHVTSINSFKHAEIKNKKLKPIFGNSFNLDLINNPRHMYPKTYIPNGYIDIIKTKNILNNFLHGEKVMPLVINKPVLDIDNIKDLNNLKKIYRNKI